MTLSKLEELAWSVAVAAPEKKPANTYAAKIPWSTVRAIRNELEAAGYDWRAGVRARVTRRTERSAAERARLAAVSERRLAWVVEHDDDRCGDCGHTRRQHRHGGYESWWCTRVDENGRCGCRRFDGIQEPPTDEIVAEIEKEGMESSADPC